MLPDLTDDSDNEDDSSAVIDTGPSKSSATNKNGEDFDDPDEPDNHK